MYVAYMYTHFLEEDRCIYLLQPFYLVHLWSRSVQVKYIVFLTSRDVHVESVSSISQGQALVRLLWCIAHIPAGLTAPSYSADLDPPLDPPHPPEPHDANAVSSLPKFQHPLFRQYQATSDPKYSCADLGASKEPAARSGALFDEYLTGYNDRPVPIQHTMLSQDNNTPQMITNYEERGTTTENIFFMNS